MKSKIFVLVILVLSILLGACSNVPESVQDSEQSLRTITVTGYSQVPVTPDIAYLTVGSRQGADTVASAVENSNLSVGQIKQALIKAGVAEDDIKTTNFSVYTMDKWTPDGLYVGYTYVAENNIYITVRDLDKLGDILNEAVNAGANNIWGIQFDLSDKSEALSQGRKEAVEKAYKQALELAEAAGVTLGEIQYINYTSNTYLGYGFGGGGGGGAEAAISVSPGQLQITVDVTITYTIE